MLSLDIRLLRHQFTLELNTELPLENIWAIMGPSGCGKTSLLRCIAGLERQAQGRVVFNNQVWLDSGQGILMPPEQRRIGYIFQEPRLFPHLSVQGNLNFAMRRAKISGADAPVFDEVVNQIGIRHLLGRGIERLSGGEKQRVAIARALLNAPQLLLMDEPMASLDWVSKVAIMPCLRRLSQHYGLPVVMVSHSREEVARLADNLLLMEKGRNSAQGSCRSLLNQQLDQDEQVLSVLTATVVEHDTDYALSGLDVDGVRLVAHCNPIASGAQVRVVILAHEVSIVLDDIQQTSVQNRLPVVIESISIMDNYHSLVSLRLKEQNLMALLTRQSVDRLSLEIGQRVFAHVKASGLEVY